MNAKIYFTVVVLAFMFITCSKYDLDKFPLDSPSDATFYSTEAELEFAVRGIYNVLWWHSQNQQVMQRLDCTTEMGWLRGQPDGLADGSATSTLPAFRSFWADLYKGISRANNLLTNMHRAKDGMPGESFLRIEAEAKFLRAYFYHFLVEMYGDVPLLKEQPKLDESMIGRSSKSEVVDFIISDLESAKDYLPVSWPAKEEGRATKGAALTLLARIALYNKKYDLAIQASQQVMNLQRYSLYPDYKNLFQYEGVRCSEVILDVAYLQGQRVHAHPQNAGTRMLGSNSNIAPSQFLIDAYEATDGLPIDESLVYDPSRPFNNRDPRLDATIIRPQSVFGGFVFETDPDSVATWRVENNIRTTRVANTDVTNAFATFTGYLWKKYNSESDYPAKRSASDLNFILMRYAEVLLIYAEAKIESNDIDQSVLDALNRIRARAYGVADFTQVGQYPPITTADQAELRRRLRNERKIELAYEGFRLFDIRRWGIAEKVLSGPLIGRPIGAYSKMHSIPDIDNLTGHPDYGTSANLYRSVMPRLFQFPRDLLYPIPQDEVNVNENIIQNPGY
ncbi:MAG: RagB/SusD family nutrient uptake outer membrane protein [Chitinophagaceae bacterium]|nr:RagB/SusD family nutrient uptake outer membrane protein [Chitinophagaceae bacterium]